MGVARKFDFKENPNSNLDMEDLGLVNVHGTLDIL